MDWMPQVWSKMKVVLDDLEKSTKIAAKMKAKSDVSKEQPGSGELRDLTEKLRATLEKAVELEARTGQERDNKSNTQEETE